jgi:RNase P protein component
LSRKIFSLNREEIVKGYKTFETILNTGFKTDSEFLTSYSLISGEQTGINVKAGFFISKKKLKKLTKETA